MVTGFQHQTKIMIVEDDPNILFSLKVMFETEGYEVITVKNGLQCLAELEEGFQGIIILDLMMPIMNGVETIKNMIIEGFVNDNIIIVLTVKKIQGEEFDEIYPYIYEYITKIENIYKNVGTCVKHGFIQGGS